MKYQYIDSSFITNKNGKFKHNGRCNIGRNKFYKNKNGVKLSIICDSIGIPNSIVFKPGSVNDSIIRLEYLNKLFTIAKNYSPNKQSIIMGDKGYDTQKFRQKCKENNLRPLIDYNKRNTKNKDKIKKLSNKEKFLYNKRIKVENCFSWCRVDKIHKDKVKQNKRIDQILDKNTYTFQNFVYLGMCKLISNFFL